MSIKNRAVIKIVVASMKKSDCRMVYDKSFSDFKDAVKENPKYDKNKIFHDDRFLRQLYDKICKKAINYG